MDIDDLKVERWCEACFNSCLDCYYGNSEVNLS